MNSVKNLRIFFFVTFIFIAIFIRHSNSSEYINTFHLEKAKSYASQALIEEAINEIMLQKNFLDSMSLSEKLDYYEFVANISCNNCTKKTLDSFRNFVESMMPELIMMSTKLNTENTQLDYLDLMVSIVQIRKFQSNGEINFELASITNEIKNASKSLKLDEMHSAMLNLQLFYLVNGTCSYEIKKRDKRCNKFLEPTIDMKNVAIENILDNSNKDSFKNINSNDFFSLLGSTVSKNRKLDNNVLGRFAKKLLPIIKDEKWEKDIINLLICDGSLCEKEFFLSSYYDLEMHKLEKNSNNKESLRYAVGGSIEIALYYSELGNIEKELYYYSKFIDHLIDLYNIVDHQELNDTVARYSGSLVGILQTANKIIYEEKYGAWTPGFELGKIEESDFIKFLVDGEGSKATCENAYGINKYLPTSDSQNKIINPNYYCDYPHFTSPLLFFKNIKKDSQLYNLGIKNGDFLIAVNDYLADSTIFFDLYSTDNIEQIMFEFLRGFDETDIIVLKKEDYANYKLQKPEPINLSRYQFKNLEKKKLSNVSQLQFETAELAFKAVQLLFTNSATNSFDKMKSRINFDSNNSSNILKNTQDLSNEIYFLEKKLFKTLNKDNKSSDLLNIKNEIATKRLRLEELIGDNAELSLIYKNSKNEIYSLSDIMPLISDNELLLMYVENISGHFLFQITGDNKYAFSLENLHNFGAKLSDINYSSFEHFSNGNLELRQKIRNQIELKLVNKEDTNFLAKDNFAHNYSENLLNKAVTNNLYLYEKIIFMSNISDSFIPLSILPAPSNIIRNYNKNYLIDDFVVSNLISLDSFKFRKNKNSSNRNLSFLGVADPIINKKKSSIYSIFDSNILSNIFRNGEIADRELLKTLDELPETSIEVKNIAKNFNSMKTDILTRGNATEKNLKSMDLSKYDVINFATHSIPVYENSNFDYPGLVLTLPKNSTKLDDGYLTPQEIAKLNINAEIIILSACNTASGSKGDDEILSGLAQAFLYAGAKSIIVSHWVVESTATEILMTEFFDNWMNVGMDVPTSLANAKIYLRDNFPEFSHPSYWGAFTYYGL